MDQPIEEEEQGVDKSIKAKDKDEVKPPSPPLEGEWDECEKANVYQCERCSEIVKPVEDTIPDFKTHLIACALFFIGLPFLIFIPYCCDWYGKPVSRCPRCGNFMKIPPPEATPTPQ